MNNLITKNDFFIFFVFTVTIIFSSKNVFCEQNLRYYSLENIEKNGIYINGFYFAQLQGVPSGGYRKGVYGGNWAQLGFDLDLKKILKISGASIHFAITQISGQGRSWQYNGAYWSYISTWGNHNGLQLREFDWDQSLLDNKLHILFGRFNKSGEFDTSELYCQFSTIICSSPTTFLGNSGGPSYVTSSWAARILYKPTTQTYLKAAVYQNDPQLALPNHNSWPGRDWGVKQTKGFLLPFEVGYKTNFLHDSYPRSFSIGGTYDTSPYNSYDNIIFSQSNQTLARRRSMQSSLYLQAQQMVWKPKKTDQRGLIIFGAANFTTLGSPPLRDGFVLGMFDYGPFRFRPHDSVGLIVQHLLFNHANRRIDQELLNNTDNKRDLAGEETMLELNYGANITKGIKLQPYFEYIWHPDQMNFTKPRGGITHAVQIGFLLDVEINDAFNLPSFSRTKF